MTSEIDWESMVETARELLILAPWKNHLEEDLFAIQPHEDSPVYFVSVMGNLGEHHAIAYYPGRESLSAFRAAQEDFIPERARIDALLLNGHLQAGFEPRKLLTADDAGIFKALGKRFHGKWPVFRSHRSARVPWQVNAAEAHDLARLMEETVHVLNRKDGSLLRPCYGEEFFLRTWDGKDSTCRVDALPETRHVIQAEMPHDALAGLEKARVTFEVDLCLMPIPISDVPAGEPPYFPMLVLVAEPSSGAVVGMEMLSTVDGVDATYARVPEALVGILKKAGAVPAVFAARHPILCSALEAWEKAYGTKFQMADELPAVDEAVDSLIGFMQG